MSGRIVPGHTPGPWVASTTPAGKGKVTANGFSVANTTSGPYSTQMANAHLIAAAPDLLTALKQCVRLLEAFGCVPGPACPQLSSAYDAVKKAEGES